MIVMHCRWGLANRLFYFSHCVALAEATGHRVFTSNIKGHDFGKSGAFCFWPGDARAVPWPDWMRRAFNAVFLNLLAFWVRHRLPGPKIVVATLDTTGECGLSNPAFLEMLRSHRLVIMTGWVAIERIVLPEPDTIRDFFAPDPELAMQCAKVAQRARGDADVLIGVHCRWGDYSWYGNGCFYYSVEAYSRVMRHCVGLFPGKRVAFLVVSDQPDRLNQHDGLFDSLKITPGPNTIMEDLYSLARCDYIVCPASSFSLWAAFQGGKPVWCMADETRLPELTDFIIRDHTFEGAHPEGEHREAQARKALRRTAKT